MRKLITILLTILTVNSFSQNVGISGDPTFTPNTLLDIDGDLKVRNDIYLENFLIDLDNSSYFIDINSTSKFNEIEFDNGSQTDPSIWFEDDNNTGIYQPSDGSIGVTINGSEAIRITSSRNLFMNNNDITGIEQLHFESGSIWIDGNPGEANQILRSDGNNIQWEDAVIEKSVAIDFNTTWTHPFYDIDIDFDYTNSSSAVSIIVYNNTPDTWRFFFSGVRNGSSEKVDTYSITSGNSETISISSSGATIGIHMIGTSYVSDEGFIYQLVGYGPSKLFRGTLTYW